MVGSLIILGSNGKFNYVYSGISSTLIGSFVSANNNFILDINNYNGNLLSLKTNSPVLLYTHSGISSVLTGSIAIYSEGNTIFPRGVAVVGGSLYTSTGIGSGIYFYSGISDVVTGSIALDHVASSLAELGGNLYHLFKPSDNNAIIYKHNGVTSSYLGSVVITDPSDTTNAYDGGFCFDSNGNLLLIVDGDTTATFNWTLYQYSGFSNTLVGSLATGSIANGNAWYGLTYIEATSGPQINNLALSDSLNLSDSFTKALRLSKTLSDSSSVADSFIKAGVSNKYTITVNEAVDTNDGETIGKKLRLSKTFSDSSIVSDSFSHSIRTPRNITYLRINIT